MTTTLDGTLVKVKPDANATAVVASTMKARGAMFHSTQWQGWEPDESGCPKGGDLKTSTFTVSNGGVYGSMMSTPILNPPQTGILGMHKIMNRPVEDQANPGQIVLKPMMYLAFSYDHRLIDGTEAVSFLVRIKECIENPERILLEV